MIGEGDFSASLAILRAYYDHSNLHPDTATTNNTTPIVVLVMTTVLTSAHELYTTYPDTARRNVQEIQDILFQSHHHHHHTEHSTHDDNIILFGIDACQLHTTPTKQRLRQHLQRRLLLLLQPHSTTPRITTDMNHDIREPNTTTSTNESCWFDTVLFQYPHLGIPIVSTTPNHHHHHHMKNDNHRNNDNVNNDPIHRHEVNDETQLRQRHVALLHHYFYAASFLSSTIHVTLNTSQYQSWIVRPQQGKEDPPVTTISSPRIQNETTNTAAPPPILVLDTTLRNDNSNHNHNKQNQNHGSPKLSSTVYLQLQKIIPVQQPFHWIFPNMSYTMNNNTPTTEPSMTTNTTTHPWSEHGRPSDPMPHTKNQKRSVSKKYNGGSHRHYLTKYGYHHVRTITATTPTMMEEEEDVTHQMTNTTNGPTKKKMTPVSLLGSCHYVWERVPMRSHNTLYHSSEEHVHTTTTSTIHSSPPMILDHHHHRSCPICGIQCSNPQEYETHLQHPTMYPIRSSLTNHDHLTIGSVDMNMVMKSSSTTSTTDSSIHPRDGMTTDDTHRIQSTISSENESMLPTTPSETDINRHHHHHHHHQCIEGGDDKNEIYPNIPTDKAGSQILNWNHRNTTATLRKHKHELLESMVTTEHIGKRLRWFVQHAMMNHGSGTDAAVLLQVSKRQSERWIQQGCVSIHDEIVMDSSRILHQAGWMVRVNLPQEPQNVLPPTCTKVDGGDPPCVVTSSSTAVTTTRTKTTAFDDTSEPNTTVTIVASHPMLQSFVALFDNCTLLVVWKPVGMRTIGSFTNATLEQYLFHHHQSPTSTSTKTNLNADGSIALTKCHYNSLSKLDKGCSGLCVVVQQLKTSLESSSNPIKQLNVRIQHTFTAMVYGTDFPEEWKAGASILLPVYGLRRWNSKKRRRQLSVAYNHINEIVENGVCDLEYENDHEVHGDDDSCRNNDGKDDAEAALSHEWTNTTEMEATVTLIEQTRNTDGTTDADHIPALSTISIATSSSVSGLAQTIGYYLRSNKYSIVGDRMAAQEYNTLPRAVRNRIKQRLCLGCTGVRVNVTMKNESPGQQLREQRFETNHPIPVKWSAMHWQEFCSKSNLSDG